MTSVRKELECTVCTAIMIDPRVLACQHTFCLRCIYKMAQRDQGHNVSLRCPFGCPEITVTADDIRSVKKNVVLANLCSIVRQSDYDRGDCLCDECNKVAAKRSCDVCSMHLCEKCDNDSQSDHAFVCALKGREAANKKQNVPRYEFFLNEWTCQMHLEARLEKVFGRCQVHLDVQPYLIAAHVESMELSATHKLFEVRSRHNIPIYSNPRLEPFANDIEERATIPYTCLEMSALREIQDVIAIQFDVLQEAQDVLIQCQAELLVDRSITFRLQHVALVIDHCCAMYRQVVLPFIKKLLIIANLHNVVFLSGLQTRMGRLQSKDKQSVQKQIMEHQELSSKIQSMCLTSQQKLTESQNYLEKTVRAFMNTLRFIMKPENICEVPVSCNDRAKEVTNSLGLQVCRIHQKQYSVLRALSTSLKSLRSAAIRSSASGDDALNQRFIDNEEDLEAQVFRFHSMLGCTEQFRNVIRLLCDTQNYRLHQNIPSVGLGVEYFEDTTERGEGHLEDDDDDEPRSMRSLVSRLPDMMENLQPHIQEIRTQQRELMSQHPDRVDQHLALQEQLKTVLLQSLDLLERDHSLRLKEGIQVYSIQARRQLDMLVSALQQLKVHIILPNVESDGLEILSIATSVLHQMVEALPGIAQHSYLSRDVHELNEASKKLLRVDASQENVRPMIFQQSLVERSMQTGDDVDNNGVSITPTTRPTKDNDHMYVNLDVTEFNGEIPDRAKTVCLAKFQKEIQSMMGNQNVTVSVRRLTEGTPPCVFVPFYIGTYTISNIPQLAGQRFPVVIQGQRGDVYAHYPKRPVKEILWSLFRVCTRSKQMWFIGNLFFLSFMRTLNRRFLKVK